MDTEANWKQLNQYIDLYKFHWDLALKLCIFFLGISGAVSAYVIKNQDVEYMGISLVIPIGLCLFGSWLAHSSLPGLHLIRNEAQRLGEDLNLESYPEFRSLITFVNALRFLLFTCAVGMLVLWFLINCA
ncbi:hypothetical protein [Teredinibacter turnerae]|uniref:hypothetical protein n=1 Tax=Teredinibacter turnerae TaxID=2426 RepID=UPI0005A081BE|nr:hypothetical protein [Teredinibacter turnerae]